MPLMKKEKRHSKYNKYIYFDTETVFQESTPIEPTILKSNVGGIETTKVLKRLNVIAYAVGWCYADFFWRLDLINNVDKPLQVDLNKTPIFIRFGKNAVDHFIQYLDTQSKKYDLIVYVHNAAFDIPFLSAARDKYFKNFDEIKIIEEYGNKRCIRCKWTIKKPGYKTQNIEFKDTNLFENRSLKKCIENFIDENGEKMNKDKIEYEKTNMEFNDDGSIKCYYINKRIKVGINSKGEIVDKKESIKVNWDDVAVQEYEYLVNDIKGLPLLDIQQMRLKNIAYNTVKEKCNLTDMKPRQKRRLLQALTKGTFGKMLCSWIQEHEYADNEQIKKWVELHKGNYFNALLKHRYEDKESYLMDLRSMFGGFTSFGRYDTWTGKQGEFAYLVDVNSLYPSIMSEGLPVGAVLNEKPEGIEGVDYLKQYIFKPVYETYKDKKNRNVYKAILPRWKPQYPFRTNVLGNSFFIKYKYIEGEKKPSDEFTIWSFYFEDVIKKMCDYKFEFVGYRYQLLGNPLIKYMDAMQKIKQENTDFDEGSGSVTEIKYQASKILSNAMYGKSMEKKHEDTIYFHDKLRLYMNKDEFKLCGGEIHEEPYFTGNTGSYICSKARHTLILAMKAIFDLGGDIYYCDTDSIMFTLEGELPKEIPIHNKELGKFKVERIFNCFRGNGKCKKYHVSLRNINLKDSEIIPWIKNNHPSWVWQHLEGKELNDWKKLIKPKFASSGFDKDLIKQLPLEIIDILYSPNENIRVFNARNAAKRDELNKVTLIKRVDSDFNVDSDTENNYGLKVKRGLSYTTGVLYPEEINGVEKWVFKRKNELELIDDNKEDLSDFNYGKELDIN